MAMPASSSDEQPRQPLSKQQAYWKARRKIKAKFTQVGPRMAISMGLFACLAFVAEQGAFASWSVGGPEAVQQVHADLASIGFGAQPQQHSEWQGRQLQYVQTPMGWVNVTEFTCMPEANVTSVFPPLAMESSRGAATVFMIIVTLYMFLGLAIACDSFFESSLSAICENLKLKDDVAGATFMAAGGSAPEFATSFIGVFITRSDVGFGTIVGSAVFNVLFVIACCAFVAPNLQLTWWPLARDAAYYCFALAMIVIFVSDDLKIKHYEATILFLMYCGYVTIMYFNERLEAWVTARVQKELAFRNPIQTIIKKLSENTAVNIVLAIIIVTNGVMAILEITEFNRRAMELPCLCGFNVGAAALAPTAFYYVNLGFNIFFLVEMAVKMYGFGVFGYWRVPLNAFDGSLVFLIIVEFILNSSGRVEPDPTNLNVAANDGIGIAAARSLRIMRIFKVMRTVRVLRLARLGTAAVTPTAEAEGDVEAKKERVDDEKPAKEEGGEGEGGGDDDDDDDDGPFNPFEMWGGLDSPGGIFGRTMWFIGLPLSVIFWLTIPDCRRPMFAKFWIGTFASCIIWIAILSAVMVWMVERLGKIYGVPESIMGIFVLAAGTSIPDCLSSIAVARRGHGDMAVSSSIGSNIFDVLIGLPVPWFLYTAVLRPSGWQPTWPMDVPIASEALAVMILTLFIMVALVITTIHLSGWLLTVRLGVAMMGLYFVFLVVALLLDRGFIFGDCTIVDPLIGG